MDCRVQGVAKSQTQLSDYHSFIHGNIVHVLIAQSCPILATPWTIACQAPLFMGFPRQEYQNGLPFPPPGDLSNPGIKPSSPVSPVLEAESLAAEPPGKPLLQDYVLAKTKLKRLLGCILEIFLNASPLDNNQNKLTGSSYSNPILAIALERLTHDHTHTLTNMGNSPYQCLNEYVLSVEFSGCLPFVKARD